MSEDTTPRVSRRGLLLGGAAAGVVGAGAAIGISQAVRGGNSSSVVQPEAVASLGASTIPFYGEHQAGIAHAPQAHANFIALDLPADASLKNAQRLMRLLTDDAARMTQGDIALADGEAELSEVPANLTVTFGFGPGFVSKLGLSAPNWLQQMPAFGIDQLQEEWSEGDLLIRVGSDDPLTVAHTSRMLLKDARTFSTVRWTQPGFRRAAGSTQGGATMRNMFGQVDGTVNLVPGTAEFDQKVWSTDGWMAGGTSVVIRRIHMNLDKWDQLDRSGREQAVGRTLRTGAPLTGTLETDEPDFDAKLSSGFPVIAEFSHMRRARGEDVSVGAQILRHPYSYADGPAGGSVSNSGLIFVAYQADPVAQFVPIQERLDKLDLLNTWTTPIGSAVFAIPPGCAEGGYVGETLLGA